MTAWSSVRSAWSSIGAWAGAYLANVDPLAHAANAGAFLVWSSQPLYPLEVWLMAGPPAWPAMLTWLSTPFFFGVPLLARRSSSAGRALFVIAGVANTLLATKAFGTASAVGWFLAPCALLVTGFFRRSEWRLVILLGLAIAAAAFALPHLGSPLHVGSAAASRSLIRLHLLGAGVLSIYLLYVAYRARFRKKVGA